MGTRRATLIVEVHQDDAERRQLDAWLARWESRLLHCSENLGCGCCVDMYEVEAPVGALDELPEHFIGGSDWSDGPAAQPPPRLIDRLRDHWPFKRR